MRRIFTTLGITALLALVASPALARPNSPNGRTPNSQHGWVADHGNRDGKRVERVAPAPYIAPAKLRRAKRVRAQYMAEKSRLLTQIRAQKRLIRTLKATPYRGRANRHYRANRANARKIRVAERQLSRLELKLSSLELMYQTRLARLMPRSAINYFNITFG